MQLIRRIRNESPRLATSLTFRHEMNVMTCAQQDQCGRKHSERGWSLWDPDACRARVGKM